MANVKDSLNRLAESVGISAGATLSTDGSPTKKEGGNWLSKLLGGIHVNGNVSVTKEGTSSGPFKGPGKDSGLLILVALAALFLIFNPKRR